MFTLYVINIIVGYILFRVVVVSSGYYSTIGTLGGFILAGVHCDGSIWVTSMCVFICGFFNIQLVLVWKTPLDVLHVYFFVEYFF